MDVRHVLREVVVHLRVHAIHEQEEDVETREERLREVDVLGRRPPQVVPPVRWVRRRKHARAGVERGGDASLGDRHSLLLHHLMDGSAVRVLHLVELVDAADALVRKHERAALKHHLSRELILGHSRRETHARGALACRVHPARRQPCHVLEELRLGDSRVPHEAHVHVPADPHPVVERTVHPADQLEEEGLLDVLVPEDLRGDRGR
mmetsp:Transcript_19882/g.48164  ORF Transcript_19882/g.48164 Transcript_19882/m.48164 type:complete len:207 (-) Transcript_19882:822-1442(-)